MKNKVKIILLFVCVVTLSLSLAACAEGLKIEDYEKRGYKVFVTYDANGGNFLGRSGVSIMDLFKPDDYQADASGVARIKLIEPTSETRPVSGASSIKLTRPGYFFAGWYKTRSLLTNEAGNVVDESGAELELLGDTYVYAGTEDAAQPAYIYSDYWDFGNDVIEYAEGDGLVSFTLYAGWVQYYEFHYYHQKDGEWELFGKTDFDYKSTNAQGSSSSDHDTIWIPDWHEGSMKHSWSYSDRGTYTFPKVSGATFSKAYLDPECTQEITEAFRHEGTLDIERGIAVNRVQNIYVALLEGERYRIETAEQLSTNPNLNGYYEILADLDFSDVSWPALLSTNTFNGRIYSAEGNRYSLKNISVRHTSDTATVGGLFGIISETAVIKDVSFENVTYDIARTGARLRDTSFGLFAGIIEDGAEITDVEVGGTFKLGEVTLGDNYSINLLANGNVQGIVQTEISLQVYARVLSNRYLYNVDPESVEIDDDGDITMTLLTLSERDEPFYIII